MIMKKRTACLQTTSNFMEAAWWAWQTRTLQKWIWTSVAPFRQYTWITFASNQPHCQPGRAAISIRPFAHEDFQLVWRWFGRLDSLTDKQCTKIETRSFCRMSLQYKFVNNDKHDFPTCSCYLGFLKVLLVVCAVQVDVSVQIIDLCNAKTESSSERGSKTFLRSAD